MPYSIHPQACHTGKTEYPEFRRLGGAGGGVVGGKKVKARRVSIPVRMRIGEEVRTRP